VILFGGRMSSCLHRRVLVFDYFEVLNVML